MKRKRYTHYYYVGDEELHDTPIKKLKSEVESYMIKYRKYKLKLEFSDSFALDEEEYNQTKQFVEFIDKVITYLRPDAKDYIVNQYLSSENNPLWWSDIYSRSSFFKVRKLALIEFLQYVR